MNGVKKGAFGNKSFYLKTKERKKFPGRDFHLGLERGWTGQVTVSAEFMKKNRNRRRHIRRLVEAA